MWWGICIWLCNKFPTESNSERILKIGQYLVKLWPRVWCLVFFDSRCRRPNYCSQGVVYCAKTIWLWVYQYLSVIRLIVSFICKCKSTNLPLATIWRHWRQHFASNIFLCMHGTTLMSLKQLHATKSHDFVLAALDKTAKTVVLAVLSQCFIIL